MAISVARLRNKICIRDVLMHSTLNISCIYNIYFMVLTYCNSEM